MGGVSEIRKIKLLMKKEEAAEVFEYLPVMASSSSWKLFEIDTNTLEFTKEVVNTSPNPLHNEKQEWHCVGTNNNHIYWSSYFGCMLVTDLDLNELYKTFLDDFDTLYMAAIAIVVDGNDVYACGVDNASLNSMIWKFTDTGTAINYIGNIATTDSSFNGITTIDIYNGYLYAAPDFGNTLHKIRLSDFTLVDTLTVPTFHNSSVIHIDQNTGTLFMRTSHAGSPPTLITNKINVVDLASFTIKQTYTVTLDSLSYRNIAFMDDFLYVHVSTIASITGESSYIAKFSFNPSTQQITDTGETLALPNWFSGSDWFEPYSTMFDPDEKIWYLQNPVYVTGPGGEGPYGILEWAAIAKVSIDSTNFALLDLHIVPSTPPGFLEDTHLFAGTTIRKAV